MEPMREPRYIRPATRERRQVQLQVAVGQAREVGRRIRRPRDGSRVVGDRPVRRTAGENETHGHPQRDPYTRAGPEQTAASTIPITGAGGGVATLGTHHPIIHGLGAGRITGP